jgi:hypothetical protein
MRQSEGTMREDQTPDGASDRLQGDGEAREPFRASGSGESYEPSGNWGAQRRLDQVPGDVPHGMEGRPRGAVAGGYGPEGNYGGEAGQPNADVLGQVKGDPDRLADEAQELGPVRPDRAFVGSNQDPATRPAGDGGAGRRDDGERDRR